MNKTSTIEYFSKNNYVVLSGSLTEDECKYLTNHMFALYDQGKLEKDNQCPLSDAIYGDKIFDDLLQKFAKPIGDSIGKKLIPTYSYARIYRNGEVLEKHTDRPACEYSATLTLGYDSKPIWPIFVDEKKQIPISLDAGELVVYKGCELMHWRPKFKGQWHVQVFLHYVDADGPHADQAKDGRKEYGSNKYDYLNDQTPNKDQVKQVLSFPTPIFNSIIIKTKQEDIFPGYFCIDDSNLKELKFTQKECEKIIKLSEADYGSIASIGGNYDDKRIMKKIRSANIFNVVNNSDNEWIYRKVSNAISIVNSAYFDYDLVGITHELQLVEYDSEEEIKGHYDWHVDCGSGDATHRKISFTAQLSHPSEYEGCELIINNHCDIIEATKEQGSIHLFPSYLPHKVNPVTKGKRYALVIWIHGPRRFK